MPVFASLFRRLCSSIPSPWIGWLAALAAALIGSGWQLASRHGVTTTLGPVELAVLRYAIPALVLAPLWLRRCGWPAGLSYRRCALLVLCGGLPFGLVVLAGARWAPAAHMGIFVAGSLPVFTALGGWLVSGERPAPSRLLGLALIVAGMAAFGAAGWRTVEGAWRGDLLFLLAALLWSVYTLAFRSSGLTPWQGAAVVNLGSALLLLPVLLVAGAPRLLSAPWSDVAWQALGQGVAAGLLGLAVYSVAIARLGPARAALSAALVPLLTAAGGAWLLAEPVSGALLTAVLLVVPGLALGSGALAQPLRRQSASGTGRESA
ncbi:DMT family transporter [Acidovorax sp. Root219]|uniref:DMT family transporter n=1 Tax=Acidovorax sp. Root219 TaxID=1736493 RepID=UPI0009EC5F61|nr:DMT family transporter [Acidovorax sp. Root219]